VSGVLWATIVSGVSDEKVSVSFWLETNWAWDKDKNRTRTVTTQTSWHCTKTRKLCYCKDDCAMRPIYRCPGNFRESL